MANTEPSYVPQDGVTLLVGQIGSSLAWHFFDDTVKGREAAQTWLGMGAGAGLKRLFRVYFDEVVELEITPPVAAKLREKTRKQAEK